MSRTLTNGAVTVTLDGGTWTAEWPATGVGLGPVTARVELADGERRSRGRGSWTIETADGPAGPGARARWSPRGDGPWVAIDLPVDGPVLVVEVGYHAPADTRLDRIVALDGPADLGGPPGRGVRLVEGYDSWAYAGVRPLAEPGRSWWRAAFASGPGGPALGVTALTARRLATVVSSTVDDDRIGIEVAAGATPPIEPVPGTWGYTTAVPGGLGTPLPAGAEARSEPVAVAAGAEPLALLADLAGLAGRTARARRWGGAPVTGWESWYHYGLAVEPAQVLDNARRLRERFAGRPGFDLVQLDDGWQVTYGAWWPNDRFPADLSELTGELRALGCRPGLWLAPFMVQPGAPGLGAEHPDWCVAGPGGEPIADRFGRWALDASRPDVRTWLSELGARVAGWGFEMVKLDFCYLGAVEGVRHDPRATGTEALRLGLAALVEGLGPDVYVLGCGIPLLPAVGPCHGARVGHDLAVPVLLRDFGQPLADWRGFLGVRPQARNVAARAALHRHWFDVDPDVVMAWGSDGRPDGFSVEESRTLATLAALAGGAYLLADELASLREEELAVLEELADLAWGEGFLPLDLLSHADRSEPAHAFSQPGDLASVWSAERGGRRVVALFNWTDEAASRPVPEEMLPARERWTGAEVRAGELEVPAHGVRLLVREA
ncbi:MAG: alpha-galactosidase [Acidimicrobiia bacterium]|nr:alpha-galactosidase [Acidimicrobiia bacterium]